MRALRFVAIALFLAVLSLPTRAENAPQPLSLASSLKASLVPAEGPSDQRTPFTPTLSIENPTAKAVTITDFILLGPPYLTLHELPQASLAHPPEAAALRRICAASPSSSPASIAIVPGGSIAVPLMLCAAASVLPGTHAIAIGFSANAAGAAPAILFATGKVTLGVPGVSEALQFLGIPSLLLAPGALSILAFIWLLALATGAAPIDWKQPGPLLLTVVISLLYLLLYPWATRLLTGTAHDYLERYSLADIAWLWGSAVIIGLVAAGLLAAWQLLQLRNEPAATDTPRDLLRKLARNGSNFRLDAFTRIPAHDAAPDPQQWLRLPFGKAAADEFWLVPKIAYAPRANDQPSRERANRIRAALDEASGSKRATRALCNAVEQGVARGEITLAWEGEGDGPRRVSRDAWRRAQDADGRILFRPA